MSEQVQRVINSPNEIIKPYLERQLIAAERERNRGYTPYRHRRVQPLHYDQINAMRGIRSLQIPTQMRDARNLYGKAANMAGKEGRFQHGIINAGYNPHAVGMFSRPGNSQMFSRPGNAQMFARPEDLKMFDKPGDVDQRHWYGGDFSSQDAQRYMNPYQQAVIDIAKREANRAHQKQGVERGLQAAKMGAFGGSRAAIMESEAQRNHNQNMSDVQLKGMHQAYENAQGMFDRDRSARSVQAGMLSDVDKFNAGLGMQYGMAGLEAGKFNRGMEMDHGRAGLMNQHFNIGKDMDYGRMGLQNSQFNIGKDMDYGRLGLQNSQFNEGQRMHSSDMRLRQQIAQEQARLGAAGHRLGAIQAMNPMAQGLAELGRNQFGMTLDKYNTMNNMGEQYRGVKQQALDAAHQEFQRQQNWGRDSLAWQGGIMNGMPLPGSSFSYNSGPTQQAPSMTSTLAGGALGMMGAWGRR